jgi:hypothetical protein
VVDEGLASEHGAGSMVIAGAPEVCRDTVPAQEAGIVVLEQRLWPSGAVADLGRLSAHAVVFSAGIGERGEGAVAVVTQFSGGAGVVSRPRLSRRTATRAVEPPRPTLHQNGASEQLEGA